ncbi:MAG: serine acetyltransferase [Bacteroidales bacterium]
MQNKRSALAEKLYDFNKQFSQETPCIQGTHDFVETFIQTLFPICRNKKTETGELEIELDYCSVKLKELLYPLRNKMEKSPDEVVETFYDRLPEVFDRLIADAEMITRFDPASCCLEEIILCYPGFSCITVYRLAHILYELKVPLLPRVMSEYIHGKTGIDIHPGAKIDSPFFIDHGTGVVIGETAVIGKNVKIYQGVTLGALTVEKGMANTKRHPTIEDNVIIYAGSTILGGKTVIGHDTVLGGNTWITECILPHSVVYRQHRVVVRDSKDFKDPVDYVI